MISTRRNVGTALSSLALLPVVASAVGATFSTPALAATAAAPTKAPPPAPFEPVSKLVKLPNFLPGLGTLYVNPKTVPLGPFLAYDHQGTLVSTIYMVPLSDLNAHKKMADLGAADRPVVSVDFIYNAGHPGVPVPHYHVILWHLANGRELVAS